MDIERGKDDDGRRWYVDGDDKGLSVTTILKHLDEDTTGLERWKARNDGQGDSPHHEHIFWYSGPRGTLCHYDALSQFEDHFEGDEMWGEEEASSIEDVMVGPSPDDFEDGASAENRSVAYSLLVNHDVLDSREQFDALFPDPSLTTILERDRNWFEDTFEEACSRLYIDESDVIAVEKYLVAEADGNVFGGQADLVYRDADGNVVMADLKTSSSLRHKHRLQVAAYANAIEQTEGLPDEVDRCEVWRFCPDDESVAVHAEWVPEHDQTDLVTDDHWFDDKWGDFSYEDRADMWKTFCRLAAEASDDADADDVDESDIDTDA